MTETAMLVAMGFCAAILVALALMPLVAHRARRRAERSLCPTSAGTVEQTAADRDALRAVAAVEQRRAEQRLDLATRARADAEVELGRREVRIAALEHAGAADRAQRDAELARSRDALSAVEARVAGAEQDRAAAVGRAADAVADRAAMAAELDEAITLVGEGGQALSRLEAHAALVDAQLADKTATLESERKELGRLRAALADAGRERELARKELLLASTQRTMLEGDVRDANRRADDLRLRVAALDQDLRTAERRLVEERAEKNAAEAALADLRHRFGLLEARLVAAGRAGPDAVSPSELADLRVSIAAASDEALTRLGSGAPRQARKPRAEPVRDTPEPAAGES